MKHIIITVIAAFFSLGIFAQVTADIKQPSSCNNKGVIYLTVKGGVPPYTFIWNNGEIKSYAENLKEGTYSVTVTDNACCRVIQQYKLLGTFFEKLNILEPPCGTKLGKIFLELSEGTILNTIECVDENNQPYLLTKKSASATLKEGYEIANLPAGKYTVKSKDDKNCESNYSFELSKDIVISSTVKYHCDYRLADIDLEIKPKETQYTYLWSNNYTTDDIYDINSGLYTVTVTNSQGCSSIHSQSVNNFVSIDELVSDISGTGGKNGKFSLAVNGLFPISYSIRGINNNGTILDKNAVGITDLGAGKYQVVLTDANGCTKEIKVEIPNLCEGSDLSLVTSSTAIMSFNPQGSITYVIDGGVAPLSYVISGPDNYEVKGTTTQLPFTGTNDKLEVGEYRIVVTDANGCSISTIETVFGCEQIMDPNSFKLFPVITECPFSVEFDYKVKRVANLGISIAETNFLLEDRAHKNGIDVVKVMKEKACIELKVTDGLCDYESGTILAQACVEPTCSFSTKQTGDCGEGIGMLEVVTVKACDLGNPSNISYEWEHTDENSPIVATPNFPGGKTNVTVTDANGCAQIQTFVFDVAQTGRVVGGCGSPVCVQFDLGDNLPYTFEWTNEDGVQTQIDNPTVCNLPEGNVAIKVKDGKGCVGVAHFDLPQGSKAIEVTYDVKPEKTWHDSRDGEIHIQLSKELDEPLNYNYRITNHADYQRVGDNANNPNLDFLELTAGTYYLYVTDNTTGCVTVVAIEVYYCEKKTNENVLQVSPTYDAFGSDCGLNPLDINFSFDAQTNTITATFSGKNPFHYSFKKNGKSQKSGTVTDSKGDATFAASLGLYSFVISDGRPCTYTYNLNVIAGNTSTTGINEEFWNVKGKITEIENGKKGSILLNFIAGFNKNLTYTWTGPDKFTSTEKDLLELTQGGEYCVVITDNSCGKTVPEQGKTLCFTLKDPPCELGVDAIIKGTCGNKGSISLKINGAIPNNPLIFIWRDKNADVLSSTTNTLSNLVPGIYTVSISDGKCSAQKIYEIKKTSLGGGSIKVTDVAAPSTTGSIEVACPGAFPITCTVKGLNGVYTQTLIVDFNTGNPINFTNMPQGEYSVKTIDADGCDWETKVNVNICDLKLAYEIAQDCESQFVKLKVTDNSIPKISNKVYLWSDNPPLMYASSDRRDVKPGIYTVTVQNSDFNRVCKATTTVDVPILKKGIEVSNCGFAPADVTVNVPPVSGSNSINYSWTGLNANSQINIQRRIKAGKWNVFSTLVTIQPDGTKSFESQCSFDFEIKDIEPKMEKSCASLVNPDAGKVTFPKYADVK